MKKGVIDTTHARGVLEYNTRFCFDESYAQRLIDNNMISFDEYCLGYVHNFIHDQIGIIIRYGSKYTVKTFLKMWRRGDFTIVMHEESKSITVKRRIGGGSFRYWIDNEGFNLVRTLKSQEAAICEERWGAEMAELWRQHRWQ